MRRMIHPRSFSGFWLLSFLRKSGKWISQAITVPANPLNPAPSWKSSCWGLTSTSTPEYIKLERAVARIGSKIRIPIAHPSFSFLFHKYRKENQTVRNIVPVPRPPASSTSQKRGTIFKGTISPLMNKGAFKIILPSPPNNRIIKRWKFSWISTPTIQTPTYNAITPIIAPISNAFFLVNILLIASPADIDFGVLFSHLSTHKSLWAEE